MGKVTCVDTDQECVSVDSYVNEQGDYQSLDVSVHKVDSMQCRTRLLDVKGRKVEATTFTITQENGNTVELTAYKDL